MKVSRTPSCNGIIVLPKDSRRTNIHTCVYITCIYTQKHCIDATNTVGSWIHATVSRAKSFPKEPRIKL